jgi:hypothetical protein
MPETTVTPPRTRLPEWLRITLPQSNSFFKTRALLDDLRLHTVCESAKCPNHWECWSKGTATFMIAGDHCTRACSFCAVKTAKPLALETDEPMRVAEATRRMKLNHVVIPPSLATISKTAAPLILNKLSKRSAISIPASSSKSSSPISTTTTPLSTPSSQPLPRFSITT